MAKKDPVANRLFWEARQRLGLSREQLADDANQELIMSACQHAPMTQNFIGRVEQGRIGGGMCHERRTALCTRLEADDPGDIGLIAERRRPTRTAPTFPRRAAHTLTIRRAATAEMTGVASVSAASLSETLDSTEPDADTSGRLGFGLASPAIAALVRVLVSPYDQDDINAVGTTAAPNTLPAVLSKVRRAYQHSHYGTAIAELPDLLAGIRRADRAMDVRQSAALEAEAYQVASGLLLKGGEPVLAAIAAERCAVAAERTESELAIACGARAFAHCLMAVGHAQEGVRLTIGGADRLASRVDMSKPAALSVYGALLLRGAIAAAREEDRDQAYELLDAAAGAAAHLGGDHNLLWTAFGPTNVVAHRVAVAVELGDAGSAVAYAAKISLDALELPERKAMVLLDTARALTQWGKWDRAFDAIRQAEQHAPEEIRRRPAAHQIINELAQRSPTSLRRQVEKYAERVKAGAA